MPPKDEQIFEENCGTGKGGFQPGNTCGKDNKGAGGQAETEAVDLESFRHLLVKDEDTGRTPTKDLPSAKVKAFRVGKVDEKAARGVFFAGDRKGADDYAFLHEGHEVKEYEITLGKTLLAQHQNDVSYKFFNKSSQFYISYFSIRT